MNGSQRVDESRLQAVGVLILVDQDGTEPALVGGGDLGMGEEEFVRLREEVVEVEGIDLLLSSLIGRGDLCDLFLQIDEVAVTASQQGPQGIAGVAGKTDQFRQHPSFGEALVVGTEPKASHHRFQEFLLILPVHDRESLTEPRGLRVSAEDPVTDGVKGAAPESLGGSRQKVVHTFEHLPGRLVGEGQQEDLPGAVTLLEKPGDAIRQCPRLAAAGTRDDQMRACGRGHRRKLLIVQRPGEINPGPIALRRVELVAPGHEFFRESEDVVRCLRGLPVGLDLALEGESAAAVFS